VLGALQQGFCCGFNLFSGSACSASFLSDLSLKTGEGFCWGLLYMYVGFHCPICVSLDCYNGAAFPSGELRSFPGFLSGPTELVGVAGSVMLQKTEMLPKLQCPYCLQMLHIHSQIIVLFCYGSHCALVIYLSVGIVYCY
jgi:hypothetical protein